MRTLKNLKDAKHDTLVCNTVQAVQLCIAIPNIIPFIVCICALPKILPAAVCKLRKRSSLPVGSIAVQIFSLLIQASDTQYPSVAEGVIKSDVVSPQGMIRDRADQSNPLADVRSSAYSLFCRSRVKRNIFETLSIRVLVKPNAAAIAKTIFKCRKNAI